MTNNPLARRDQPFTGGLPYDPYRVAAERNANLNRSDVEWVVTPDGALKLQDRPSWTARRTRELAEAAERDRQQFIWRQSHPITKETT